jgi:uncharacterized membrane protein
VVIGTIAGVGSLAIIAALIALIAGIIALGKRYNNTKSSRAMAIIGVILGGAFFLLLIIALLAWTSSGWI